MRVLLVVLAVVLAVPAATAKAPPPPTGSHTVVTGTAPCGTAVHGSTLWVGVYAPGRLVGIDTATGRTVRSTRVGSWACRVAVDGRAAWVARDRPGVIVRVDLRSRRKTSVAVGAGAFDVLLAAGSVWAVSVDVGTVARIDPATARVRRVFTVGANPSGVASCGGRIWVGHGRSATWVSSIDPVTLDVRRVDVLASSPRRPVCIGGVLWIVTPDTVVRIDPRSGRLLTSLQIGETLGEAAAGPDGLVWVTDKQHSLVHRITPDGRYLLDSFPAGPGAFAIARAGDAMWVTSFAGADVRRFVP